MAASIFSMKAASKNVLNMKIDEYYDIGKIEKDPDSSCHLWKGRFTRIKGKCTSRYPIETFYYVVSDGKGGNRRVKKEHYVHIMIFFLKFGQIPVKNEYDISHICHHSTCVNPEHLSREPPIINNNRYNFCQLGGGCCHGHQSYPECIFE